MARKRKSDESKPLISSVTPSYASNHSINREEGDSSEEGLHDQHDEHDHELLHARIPSDDGERGNSNSSSNNNNNRPGASRRPPPATAAPRVSTLTFSPQPRGDDADANSADENDDNNDDNDDDDAGLLTANTSTTSEDNGMLLDVGGGKKGRHSRQQSAGSTSLDAPLTRASSYPHHHMTTASGSFAVSQSPSPSSMMLSSSASANHLTASNNVAAASSSSSLRPAKSTHGSSTSLNTIGSSLNHAGSARNQLNVSTISTSSERRPLRYTPPSSPSQASAIYSRYKYYTKLAPSEPDTMRIPNHVLPASLFLLPSLSSKPTAPKSQSSLITILSIWNTMIGTSMLAMPWAIQQAGFGLGIFCILAMGAITLYTCTLVLRHGNGGFGPKGEEIELPEVCRMYLGKRGFYVSIIFALVTFVGAQIVYWVLMSNFLYATVEYAHDPNQNTTAGDTTDDSWSSYWNTTYSPLYLVILLFPLVNFKSLTFFTKFNSFGVISIAYILFFVFYKAADSGIHMDTDTKQADGHFISLVGVLTLSFFMHNGALSIVRNNRKPENNIRDLSAAYFLVGMTYAVVGIVFYISFDGDKSLIKSNFLDNFPKNDVFALVARVFLLFQMITVFPLLMYIVRFQFMNMIYGNAYPSFLKVLLLNAIITAICVTIAVVYPNIGDIIRFTGALSGLALVFALPCLIHIQVLRKKGELRLVHVAVHGLLIVIGVANFIGQFVIL